MWIQAVQSKQKGSLVVYGVIALFVIVAAAGGVYAYNTAIREAEEFKNQNKVLVETVKEQSEENTKLTEAAKKKDKLLAKRKAEVESTQARERKLNADLQTVLQDKDARKWADTIVPQSIVNLLYLGNIPAKGDKDSKGTSSRESTDKPINK